MKELYVAYEIWKLAAAKLPKYYIYREDGSYTVIVGSECMYVHSDISGADTTDFEANYKASSTAVGSVEEALIRSMIYLKAPFSENRDGDGTGKVVEEARSDYRTTIFVHNFADPCTWYQDSTRITDEVLTPNVDRTVFSSVHSKWIDLTHGKTSDEDDVSSPYLPVVKVGEITKSEDVPFGDGGDGDFSINYKDGKVTFHSPVADGVSVTASYSYAGMSEFKFSAPLGKIVRILEAECQMTTDIVMNDTLQYGIYVGDTCAKTKKYKNIVDIINEVNGAYPVVPAFGGTKRGVPADCVTFHWDFKSRTDLKGSLAMNVRIGLAGDKPCDGSFATVTFYCVTLDEV